MRQNQWVEYFDPHFAVVAEQHAGRVFLHVQVRTFNKTVLKDMFDALEGMLWKYKVLYGVRIDDKQQKFMEVMGFVPSDLKVTLSDGITREVYICQQHYQ